MDAEGWVSRHGNVVAHRQNPNTIVAMCSPKRQSIARDVGQTQPPPSLSLQQREREEAEKPAELAGAHVVL